jgi:transposase-like protein
MKQEHLSELNRLLRRYPHVHGKPYHKVVKQRILELYRKEKIGLHILSRHTGISQGLLYLWNERANGNPKYTGKSKVHRQVEFREVEIIEESSSQIELSSPSGYSVKGLSVPEVLHLLKSLHV